MSYLEVTYPKKCYILPKTPLSLQELKEFVNTYDGLDAEAYYFTHNGKLVRNHENITDGIIYAVPRLLGGKGGFGSMLRAIGAQIEKTTNREACRDLSGRRLRDINEEKRLKNWIAQQADREREAADKRRKKLERMVAEPRHEFEDKDYDKQRSELLEKVWDAVEQGVKASTSGGSSTAKKRSFPDRAEKAKRTRLWVDDIGEVSSDCDSDESVGENSQFRKDTLMKETDKVEEVKTTEASSSGSDPKDSPVKDENSNPGCDKPSEEENSKTCKDPPKKETDQVEEVKTTEASGSGSDAKDSPVKDEHNSSGGDKPSEEGEKLQEDIHPSEVNEKQMEVSPPDDEIKQVATG